MNIIGFGGVMYTLWSYEKYPDHIKYQYIKNISKDLNQVKVLYPDLEIDMSLKGYHEITRYVGEKTDDNFNPETFPFGKYRGKLLSECDDVEYLVYIFDCVHDYQYGSYPTFIENVIKRACELGLVYNEGWLITQEDYQSILKMKETFTRLKQHIQDYNKLPLTLTSNIGGERKIYECVDGVNITLTFAKELCKEMMYKGFVYYLPLINGKAKRIKGKECMLHGEWEFDENYNITCAVQKISLT